jgi:hypothetical protein
MADVALQYLAEVKAYQEVAAEIKRRLDNQVRALEIEGFALQADGKVARNKGAQAGESKGAAEGKKDAGTSQDTRAGRKTGADGQARLSSRSPSDSGSRRAASSADTHMRSASEQSREASADGVDMFSGDSEPASSGAAQRPDTSQRGDAEQPASKSRMFVSAVQMMQSGRGRSSPRKRLSKVSKRASAPQEPQSRESPSEDEQEPLRARERSKGPQARRDELNKRYFDRSIQCATECNCLFNLEPALKNDVHAMRLAQDANKVHLSGQVLDTVVDNTARWTSDLRTLLKDFITVPGDGWCGYSACEPDATLDDIDVAIAGRERRVALHKALLDEPGRFGVLFPPGKSDVAPFMLTEAVKLTCPKCGPFCFWLETELHFDGNALGPFYSEHVHTPLLVLQEDPGSAEVTGNLHLPYTTCDSIKPRVIVHTAAGDHFQFGVLRDEITLKDLPAASDWWVKLASAANLDAWRKLGDRVNRKQILDARAPPNTSGFEVGDSSEEEEGAAMGAAMSGSGPSQFDLVQVSAPPRHQHERADVLRCKTSTAARATAKSRPKPPGLVSRVPQPPARSSSLPQGHRHAPPQVPSPLPDARFAGSGAQGNPRPAASSVISVTSLLSQSPQDVSTLATPVNSNSRRACLRECRSIVTRRRTPRTATITAAARLATLRTKARRQP